ncbi:MAG: hypothetical protein ACOYBY_01045 [Dermatophilaceae bacterium]
MRARLSQQELGLVGILQDEAATRNLRAEREVAAGDLLTGAGIRESRDRIHAVTTRCA